MKQTTGEQGFAVRCPHCFEWTESSLTPEQVAVCSAEELQVILGGLRGDPEHFISPKLLRCAQPPWACPAPFEAFVFKSESDAARFIQTSQAWSIKAGFRLYRLDRVSRWDGYMGVLVCTGPVPRQRDILLDRLFDPELLQRSLAGIALEIGAPLTVYAADTLEVNGENRTIWVPIEAYSRENGIVPPRYNPFCKLCRTAELLQPLNHLAHRGNPDDCPLEMGRRHTCAGRNAPCISRDWHRCPAFLEARASESLCYASDRACIENVVWQWTNGETPTSYEHKCWAGLKEFAFPIVVHDILVGVAMTGQFLLEGEDMLSVDALVERHPSLAGSMLHPSSTCDKVSLARFRDILLGAGPKRRRKNLRRHSGLRGRQFRKS